MTKQLLCPLVLISLFSCSPIIPATPCTGDVECGEGLACVEGTCLAQDPNTCSSDQTLPCGPQEVGACRPGIQRCIGGVFENECFGAVTATAELCNGIDDDCDGVIDDGVMTTFYVDRDGDGFGSNAAGADTRQGCEKPAGFATNDSDCNDTSSSINPTATEVCDPSDVDEDCDGTANVNCGCANPGTTQACCAGRGTQTCDAHNGGATLSICTVSASLELCNAIDDDCDGHTDELYSVVGADGGVLPVDGGTIQLDGGCTVGIGACARTAPTACILGSLSCTATAGTPSNEICNAIDDDCDGVTDEASTTLCPTAGQLCTAGTCACPAGQTVCGSSCQALGGACTQGTGACARQGTMDCTNGTATCSAVPGTPSPEACNGTDDDCDGQTDESSATLCPASGQTCDLAMCVCPAGKVVCGSSCELLGGGCSVGVGACARSGAISCISGGTACNATAGTPASESCDGIDNDCDGTTDEGVTISCVPDADNDRYAANSISTTLCPDFSRGAFGNCPVGFVTAAASLGLDCNDANGTVYRNVYTYADLDNDTRCAGLENTICIGANPPAGRRISSTCISTSDCDDSNANLLFFSMTRADADNDGYCSGAAVNTCTGTSAPSGRRFPSACNAANDDCNDSNGAQFTNRQVRSDVDNDGYCAGAQITQCGGNAPNSGTRVATSCLGDDCRDSNAFATTSCYLTGGYQTGTATKSCGLGPLPTENKMVPPSSCPVGFSRVFSAQAGGYSGNAGGTCTAISDTTLTMSCASLISGKFSCFIVGDCSAD